MPYTKISQSCHLLMVKGCHNTSTLSFAHSQEVFIKVGKVSQKVIHLTLATFPLLMGFYKKWYNISKSGISHLCHLSVVKEFYKKWYNILNLPPDHGQGVI